MNFWKERKPSPWLMGVLAGAVFLTVGAFQGQLGVIWQKATLICLECIGLG